MNETQLVKMTLERAAKYICTVKCGRCPAVEEGFPCPTVCSLETLPWQCWQIFFSQQALELETFAK